MRIEQEVKLDYKDVLIRPKRSTLRSRKQVSLERTYKFRNSHQEWTGIPIMAANMDGVGTFNMAYALSHLKLFTCITKQNSSKDWYDRATAHSDYVAVSIGTNLNDYGKAKEIKEISKFNNVCDLLAFEFSIVDDKLVPSESDVFNENNDWNILAQLAIKSLHVFDLFKLVLLIW